MVRREYKKREKIKAATFEFGQSKLQYLIEYQGRMDARINDLINH